MIYALRRLEVPQLAYSGQNRLILAEAVREKERITGMCFLFTTEGTLST